MEESMHVVTQDDTDGFKYRIGLANSKDNAKALFDNPYWTAIGAYESEIQIDKSQDRAWLEHNYKQEIKEGYMAIREAYCGYILMANVWVVDIEEKE